jgi:hypothetical protein
MDPSCPPGRLKAVTGVMAASSACLELRALTPFPAGAAMLLLAAPRAEKDVRTAETMMSIHKFK